MPEWHYIIVMFLRIICHNVAKLSVFITVSSFCMQQLIRVLFKGFKCVSHYHLSFRGTLNELRWPLHVEGNKLPQHHIVSLIYIHAFSPKINKAAILCHMMTDWKYLKQSHLPSLNSWVMRSKSNMSHWFLVWSGISGLIRIALLLTPATTDHPNRDF